MTELVVGPARRADAAAIAAVYAPAVQHTPASFELAPPDEREISSRMVSGLPWFVARRGSAVVGYAYAGPHRARPAYRWAVDCSVYLSATEQGRGTSRLLYVQLLDELRRLGYVQAFAGITLPNPPSVGLHEAMGFCPVGVHRRVGFKLGRWHDVGWWQLSLVEPAPVTPTKPVRWELASDG